MVVAVMAATSKGLPEATAVGAISLAVRPARAVAEGATVAAAAARAGAAAVAVETAAAARAAA